MFTIVLMSLFVTIERIVTKQLTKYKYSSAVSEIHYLYCYTMGEICEYKKKCMSNIKYIKVVFDKDCYTPSQPKIFIKNQTLHTLNKNQ